MCADLGVSGYIHMCNLHMREKCNLDPQVQLSNAK